MAGRTSSDVVRRADERDAACVQFDGELHRGEIRDGRTS
jgi:hypothetical protein